MAAAPEHPPHITQEQADEYAIGALEPEIAALVALHVEDCPQCRALVATSQRVASSLSLSVPIRQTPPRVKHRVMRSAGIRRFGPLWTVMRFTPAAAAAAAIVVAIAAFTGMVSVRGQIGRLRDENASLESQIDQALSQKIEIEVLTRRLDESEKAASDLQAAAAGDRDLLVALLSPDSEVAELTSFEEGVSVGRLVWDSQQKRVFLVATNLPRRTDGETYQLWVNSSGRYVSIGTFNSDENGFARYETYLPEGLKTYESAVVTVEQAGGSPTRSGPSVMVTDLSALRANR
ncbi:MAG: anti-sigma factor domain-containing protein [Hyphomicrobiales bacterium]